MLDSDLAELYRVETPPSFQSVKRNIERFPRIHVPAHHEGRPKPCDHKLRSHLEFLHLAGVRAHCGQADPEGVRLQRALDHAVRKGSFQAALTGCAPHGKAGNGGGRFSKAGAGASDGRQAD